MDARMTTTENTVAAVTSSSAPPKLQKIVYSSYRELLNSYNDQANVIIDQLPSYMVKVESGFNADQVDNIDSSDLYGAPPPPPGAYGNIPNQRLPTQMNQFDTAPTCVQNAMMTKDKKPFTYTPGGIDLSQIKSPRMAKRIARNAQNEGVTGQPKQSPLAKPNGTENGNHSPSISMGAAAMGMPFQVFPTPPPQPQHKPNGNIPPPPPPSNLSAPNKPGANNTRKSPTPQSFDPPPMGFRPEIKIPTNPMAALKKVPKPQEKNDFWVEEYKKERSKSPMVERNDSPQQMHQTFDNTPKEMNNNIQEDSQQNTNNNSSEPQQYQTNNPTTNGNHIGSRDGLSETNGKVDSAEENKVNEKIQDTSIVEGTPVQRSRDELDQPQPSVYRRSFETQPQTPLQNTTQVFNNNTVNPKVFQSQPPSPSHSPAVQSLSRPASNGVPSPAQSPAAQASPKPIFNNVVPSPAQSPNLQASPISGFSSVTPPVSSPATQTQQSPRAQVIYNNVPRDTMSPFNRGASPQSGSREVNSPVQQSYQPQKNAQVGSIYIPPVPAENLAYKSTPATSVVPTYIQQEQQSEENGRTRQSTPLRWMASRPNNKETPEWAKEDNVTPSSINRPQSMYKPQPQNYASNQPQTNNNANFSTTNTYQPIVTPTPSLAANAGLKLQIQGGGNQSKERIIPIQLEQTPTNTPESPKFTSYSPRPQTSPQTGNGSTFAPKNPNQFVDQGYNNYMNSQGNPNQARVIPIAVDRCQGDGPFNNSSRGPMSSTPVVIQNNSRGNNATAPTGNTTPNQSKSFRILQKITSTEDGNEDLINEMNQPAELQRPHYSRQMMATPQQQTNNAALEQLHRMQQNSERGRQGPPMKYPQPPTYVQQRAPYQNDNEQYIPPSQQQAPEPKIYTGSAIPSRSFKLLQAMTTPENAAEMEGSDVEQIFSNDDSLLSLASSSHFPSQSSFNSRPNSFCSGGTVTPNIIVTASDDEGAQVIELLSHKLNELTNSSSSENNFDAESIDENNFYIKEITDSDNYSDGSFDHIDVCADYGQMMRSMKSLHNINDEEEYSDLEEIHLEVIHEDLSIITEEDSHCNKSNDSLLSDGTIVDEDLNDIDEVTARLPLRLSFSKSVNDENVATFEVGNSQYEDKRGRSLSITSDGYTEVQPTTENEEQWKEVDDFWGTANDEELKVERKSNYKKAIEIFSKANDVPVIPTTVECFSNTNMKDEPERDEPTTILPETIEHINDWQEVDDFWGTRNTEEEELGRKNNYKNAMSFFTTTINGHSKPQEETLIRCNKSNEIENKYESKDPEIVDQESLKIIDSSKDPVNAEEWQKVDDFWGSHNNEDESNERRSNYKNARSFFAFAVDENSGAVNSDVAQEKFTVEEKKWWERDDFGEKKEVLLVEKEELVADKMVDDAPSVKWWEATNTEMKSVGKDKDRIPTTLNSQIDGSNYLSENIPISVHEGKKTCMSYTQETHVKPTIEVNSEHKAKIKKWYEVSDDDIPSLDLKKNLSNQKVDLLPAAEIDHNIQANTKEKKWYEISDEHIPSAVHNDPLIIQNVSPVPEPEKKLRWWEVQKEEDLSVDKPETSTYKEKFEAEAQESRSSESTKHNDCWWESEVESSGKDDISHRREKSWMDEENPSWWETEKQGVTTPSIKESPTESELQNPKLSPCWGDDFAADTELLQENQDPLLISQAESSDSKSLCKTEESSESKGWWEVDDTSSVDKEVADVNTTSVGWWESSVVPTTIEEKPNIIEEKSKIVEGVSTNLEVKSTLLEEKPWWQTEGEEPVWLNTEDLDISKVEEPIKASTPPRQEEEIVRRSPSKHKEEISKRRSWWETRETSVEQTDAAKKRFSLIEDDRKSVPKLEDLVPKRFGTEVKMKSIKERIKMLETSSNSFEDNLEPKAFDSERGSLSRNSSQRSELESEIDEDSGVTDMLPGTSSQQISETDDTESENFPELRKMNKYTRAATHSRLFKLLQNENELEGDVEDEFKFTPSKKKIVHNVSITRRQKPELIKNAESMAKRRERLSLPLRKNTSIDNDNPSTPNSPRSPSISRASSASRFIPQSKEESTSSAVNEQLVSELIQSLLLKKDGDKLKNLPMEKLQAAAKRVLEEQLDSLENTSIDSTPAITPSQDMNASDYSDYYDSWRTSLEDSDYGDYEIVPSKSFRRLQETSSSGKRLPLARCPRVLSSRTINRDLARVTESPEIVRSSSERERDSVSRCHSTSRWVKIS